jgi:hypothetical protein
MLKAIMVAVDSLRSAAQPTGMLQPCQFDVPLTACVAKLRHSPGKPISFNFNTDAISRRGPLFWSLDLCVLSYRHVSGSVIRTTETDL